MTITKSPHENLKLKGLAFISVTIFCWGILAIAIKSASTSISSTSIVWFRFLFAFIGLSLYHSIKSPQKLKVLISPPWLAVIAGLGLGGNYLGFTKGVELTSPAITQIIIQLGPLSLALSGIFLFKEKLSRIQLVGFIIALLGFSLFYKDQLSLFLNTQDLNSGVAWTVFGALTWTTYAICQKFLVKKWEPSQINLLVYGVPALLFGTQINFLEFMSLDYKTWLTLIFLGANTLIAYGCLGEAFKYLPANNISILITLNPLITLLCVEFIHYFGFDWIPYAPMSALGYIGAICVILGAIIIVKMQRKSQNT